MAAPYGNVGYWFITVFLLQFSSYAVGYFYSHFFDHDKALVLSVVTGVAVSVTSGLSPQLNQIEDYQPLPIIWALSYCRWGAEALYLNEVASSDHPRISQMIHDSGYKEGNTSVDLGM